MKTLEQVLRENANKWGLLDSEYIIRIQRVSNTSVGFYVRPSDRNGDTVDFILKENELYSANNEEGVIDYARLD